jgi:hypothetical protein
VIGQFLLAVCDPTQAEVTSRGTVGGVPLLVRQTKWRHPTLRDWISGEPRGKASAPRAAGLGT